MSALLEDTITGTVNHEHPVSHEADEEAENPRALHPAGSRPINIGTSDRRHP